LRLLDSAMSHGIQLGIEAFTLAYASEEPMEGMRAFKDKRQPSWLPRQSYL
jgi:1,4-dihydroxy-2-naphthoyl-CoA synthase